VFLKDVINLLLSAPPFESPAVFVILRSSALEGEGEAVSQLAQVASGVFLVKARLVP
jgi:hypothetical protein